MTFPPDPEALAAAAVAADARRGGGAAAGPAAEGRLGALRGWLDEIWFHHEVTEVEFERDGG